MKSYKVIEKPVVGYKVFRVDAKASSVFCRDYTFGKLDNLEGQVVKMRNVPRICEQGFHFCQNLLDCFKYYPRLNSSNYVVCKVKAHKTLTIDKGDKHATNCLEIVKILSWEQVFAIIDKHKIKATKKSISITYERRGGFYSKLYWYSYTTDKTLKYTAEDRNKNLTIKKVEHSVKFRKTPNLTRFLMAKAEIDFRDNIRPTFGCLIK